jgi:hypothetical protein
MQRCPVACARFLRIVSVGRRRSPPWRSFGHPLSPARSVPAEETGDTNTSRPRSSFQRRTAKRAAFRKTGMPSAATTREGAFFRSFFLSPRDCSLDAFAPALSLTPPTLFPQLGESALLGIASVRVRSPAIHDGSTTQVVREYRRFFYPPSHAWD